MRWSKRRYPELATNDKISSVLVNGSLSQTAILVADLKESTKVPNLSIFLLSLIVS